MNLPRSEHDKCRAVLSSVLPALPSHLSRDVRTPSTSLPAKHNLLHITVSSEELVMIVLIFCCLSIDLLHQNASSLQYGIRTPRS